MYEPPQGDSVKRNLFRSQSLDRVELCRPECRLCAEHSSQQHSHHSTGCKQSRIGLEFKAEQLTRNSGNALSGQQPKDRAIEAQQTALCDEFPQDRRIFGSHCLFDPNLMGAFGHTR